ncbi:MAG: hypothetical protein ACRD0G_09260 [Acidimicrobiales bacterium]
MASFRDRFFTRPVARAMTSPLGILLAGAGAAAGILLDQGPIGAVALGAAAWGARVLAAIPRSDAAARRIDPFALKEPWRRDVQDAVQAQNRFREAVAEARSGPLRERLQEIADRISVGVEEAWRVGQQGQTLMNARRHIDAAGAARELAELEEHGVAGQASERTAEALRAQLGAAERMDGAIADARDRLRLTNARLDEAVARAVELSVQAGDVSELQGLGDDVEALVTDLEALRQGLEEVGRRPATGTS